jgi:hypothetical protein
MVLFRFHGAAKQALASAKSNFVIGKWNACPENAAAFGMPSLRWF